VLQQIFGQVLLEFGTGGRGGPQILQAARDHVVQTRLKESCAHWVFLFAAMIYFRLFVTVSRSSFFSPFFGHSLYYTVFFVSLHLSLVYVWLVYCFYLPIQPPDLLDTSGQLKQTNKHFTPTNHHNPLFVHSRSKTFV
jgi:hypothetical protein